MIDLEDKHCGKELAGIYNIITIASKVNKLAPREATVDQFPSDVRLDVEVEHLTDAGLTVPVQLTIWVTVITVTGLTIEGMWVDLRAMILPETQSGILLNNEEKEAAGEEVGDEAEEEAGVAAEVATHHTKALNHANNSLEALQSIIGSTWGALLEAMHVIYYGVVIPQLLYRVMA
ncbi:uncharacterized protein P174DRAFT_278878 [Aspergillus novofumigatus IBT 16806]|uniref:Uncharacterized protein n=1 Tax=Aspergillus novofumigatus (strain IBT 16806) TaxID=1392255 RepID=A0A2I1BZZ0_ASPN1|nr:uncharacterized protein P174DRAFT_278878 [Aspergillus novofumigatus IBT 16806]PKX90950.1 hypothetical protein P174DRAFT_278878 [Aspergillus novofumigatus IBT 16806]